MTTSRGQSACISSFIPLINTFHNPSPSVDNGKEKRYRQAARSEGKPSRQPSIAPTLTGAVAPQRSAEPHVPTLLATSRRRRRACPVEAAQAGRSASARWSMRNKDVHAATASVVFGTSVVVMKKRRARHNKLSIESGQRATHVHGGSCDKLTFWPHTAAVGARSCTRFGTRFRPRRTARSPSLPPGFVAIIA
jgi:hypothetical protein